MSIYSDYKVGALDEVEYHNMCVEENARDRYEREHMYIDEWERYAEEDDLVMESEEDEE